MRLRFDLDGVEFILANYQELREGINPDPEVTASDRTISQYRAPGIVLIESAAEIAARVQMCGDDGKIVTFRYGLDKPIVFTDQAIAKVWHRSPEEVCRIIRRVKLFCTGRDRKEDAWRKGQLISAYDLWRQDYRHHRGVRLAVPKT